MKLVKRLSALALSLIMAVGVFTTPISVYAENAEEEAYKQSLRDKGFTEDYIEPLAALHAKYDQWEFEPLLITQISRDQGKDEYTWDYVVYQEYDAEIKRNLCSRSMSSYRDFSHTTLYDSGWYKASRAAVEYEMDTRNFLSEKSIFRFLELSWRDSITLETVEGAISGTFMDGATLDGEYSDTTYAQFFYDTGKEIGVNPVFLASRIRQEQGTGKSPLISGVCGDKMWQYYDNGSGKYSKTDENGNLINAPTSGFTKAEADSYNGYYNYFNMGSSGTGYFYIYQGGMKEAIEGTPVMADKWGGSPSWDTRWKALYGGAYKAKEKYIDIYQNIPYLQKFNVDARSPKNFWGQYMQNVTASTSEGNNMYNSYADNGLLDSAISFLIPIYEGMPEEKCKQPDGSEFVSTSIIKNDADVDYFDVYDMTDISRDDGLVLKDDAMKITWRVLKGSTSTVANLGRLNLSKYDYVYIDYSTKGDFIAKADGKMSGFGLSTTPDADFSTGEDAFDIDFGTLKSGNGDDLWRRTVKLNLRSSYIGDVYLSAFMPGGDEFYIHNLVFVAEKGHTGTLEDPEAVTTEAPAADTEVSSDTDADVPAVNDVTETSGEDTEKGSSSNTLLWIVAIAVTVVAAAVVVFTFYKSQKK